MISMANEIINNAKFIMMLYLSLSITAVISLRSKCVKSADVNSKFQLEVRSFTLNFIRKLEMPN